MRAILGLVVLLLAGEISLALDFTTLDGTTYRKASVTSVEPDALHITHSTGVARIEFKNLPAEVQQRYHYDPKKAVEHQNAPSQRQKAFAIENSVGQSSPKEATLGVQGLRSDQSPSEEGTEKPDGLYGRLKAIWKRTFEPSNVSPSPAPRVLPSGNANPSAAKLATPPPSPFDSAKRSLLVISGDKSMGSGFLARYNGRNLVFTNAHVLSGNSRYKISGLDNRAIQPKEMAVAQGFDVAVFSQAEVTEGLQIAPKVEDVATIGDDVAVLGNSLGAGVVTDLRGKITGIGPEFIEVDAKFVAGNSGSPVIHLKSGMVIGIATLAIYREFKTFGKDSRFNSVERRFAQRIDHLGSLEGTSPAAFAAESMTIERIKKHTDDLIRLCLDIYDDGKVQLEPHQEPTNRLAKPVREYLHDVAKMNSKGDLSDVKARFARNCVFETKVDILQLQPEVFTGYHRKILRDELELRNVVRTAFEQLVNIQTGDRLIQIP